MERIEYPGGSRKKRIIHIGSPDEMLELGERFGTIVPAGMAVSLEGGLGAGKTFFVKGVARGLLIEDEVLSPTFILVEEYRGELPLFHFDLYRLEDLSEVEGTGLFDAVDGKNLVVVEWGDRLPEGALDFDISINIAVTGEKTRKVTIEGPSVLVDMMLEE
ncbi:MAG: tRNA (adenosine(37)-N6)-threonylcarbamoyltransferase complex ATPase subunit type 1 TsaE [Candidatus Krumholzibacteriota bacterium]|nr:tRNA (adenosine(37)-N6)-threonylcarbamoyltransferase complex ATPase subunit type 1 TsaE [Candidatus Krumholzibacteriota bacterium]